MGMSSCSPDTHARHKYTPLSLSTSSVSSLNPLNSLRRCEISLRGEEGTWLQGDLRRFTMLDNTQEVSKHSLFREIPTLKKTEHVLSCC